MYKNICFKSSTTSFTSIKSLFHVFHFILKCAVTSLNTPPLPDAPHGSYFFTESVSRAVYSESCDGCMLCVCCHLPKRFILRHIIGQNRSHDHCQGLSLLNLFCTFFGAKLYWQSLSVSNTCPLNSVLLCVGLHMLEIFS